MATKFIPRGKLSKRARKEQDARERAGWGSINPATRRIESKKLYNRKKDLTRYTDDQVLFITINISF